MSSQGLYFTKVMKSIKSIVCKGSLVRGFMSYPQVDWAWILNLK